MSEKLAWLDGNALRARLGLLAAKERQTMVEFLLHLAEFDRRAAYLPLGFSSLFDYLCQDLRYSNGAAFRRMTCCRLLRRFPQAAAMLRDGRLCLTTLAALRDVLADENASELLGKAAGLTREQVEALVAVYRPKKRPRDSVRPLPGPLLVVLPGAAVPAEFAAGSRAGGGVEVRTAAPPAESAASVAPESGATVAPGAPPAAAVTPDAPLGVSGTPPAGGAPGVVVSVPRVPPSRVEVLTEDLRVLKVTVSRRFLDRLEDARMALSHRFPAGRFEDVIGACIEVFLEQHARKRGLAPKGEVQAAAPRRTSRSRVAAAPAAAAMRPAAPDAPGATPEASASVAATGAATPAAAPAGAGDEPTTESARRHPEEHDAGGLAVVADVPPRLLRRTRYVPVAVVRAVWARDGGCCSFRGPNGHVCGSRYRLELDHLQPWALGGEATEANLAVRCHVHNAYRARQTFGVDAIERATRARRQRGAGRFPGELNDGADRVRVSRPEG
jgi:hypothetical protein